MLEEPIAARAPEIMCALGIGLSAHLAIQLGDGAPPVDQI
jgi:hypothetical protein